MVGQAGINAARVALGMGAQVTVLDLSVDRFRQLDEIFGNDIQTLVSNPFNIAEAVKAADLVVGAVLIPGARAPKLVTEEMVQSMKPGSVLVDIAIDQGGIFDTSDRVTTHDDPVYTKHDYSLRSREYAWCSTTDIYNGVDKRNRTICTSNRQ